MTTLEERREWMRAGCPIADPLPIPTSCREFKLAVDRWGKRLVVACQGCDTAWGFPGLRQSSGGDVSLVTGPVNDARQFICGHAVEGGVDREAAEKLYRDKNKERVWRWAAAGMQGRTDVSDGGVLGLPGDGLVLEHGIPSWLEKAKEKERQQAAVSKPDADGDVDDGLWAISKTVRSWKPKFAYREPADGEPGIAKAKEPATFSSTYIGGSGSAGK